jgi:hypothetical protein
MNNGNDSSRDRIVGLFLLAFLALNYPLISLFSGGWILGLPLLYVYLFAVWLVLIVLVGLAHWASARGRGH